MRRFGAAIIAVGVIMVGFVAYLMMQPGIPVAEDGRGGHVAAMNASGSPAGSLIGPALEVWLNQYDPQGRLLLRLTTQRFTHHADGNITMQNPQADIFGDGGEVIRIASHDGTVRTAPGSDRDAFNGITLRPPRDGYLNQVKLEVFASIADRDAQTPALTLTTRHAKFDAATNRLFTEAVSENGTQDLSDDVAVTMMGHDLDHYRDRCSFRGSGLVIYWGRQPERIRALEIAHADDWVIYDKSVLVTLKRKTGGEGMTCLPPPFTSPEMLLTAGPAGITLPPEYIGGGADLEPVRINRFPGLPFMVVPGGNY